MDTGWPPPELLVTVIITSGIFDGPSVSNQLFQRLHVQIAFERKARLRVGGGRKRQVQSARAVGFDIGACGVEVRIVGNSLTGLAQDREQNALGRAALVSGNDVPESGELANARLRTGRSSRCPHRIRRRASWPPTVRWTWRWCRNPSVSRSKYRWSEPGTSCSRPRCRICSRCSGVVRRSGSTLLMRKGSMMVRTQSVYRWAARQEFRVDLALHRSPVNFQTPRGFLITSGLPVNNSRVARERLIGGKAAGPQVR